MKEQAHWIVRDVGYGGRTYECSKCGKIFTNIFYEPILFKECPNCGAVLNKSKIERKKVKL